MLILTAHQLTVAPGDRDLFDALRTRMLRDIQPVNSLQIEYFNQALRAAWDLRRCDAAERALASAANADPLLNRDTRLDRIHRLRRLAERSHRQAIAELRKTQTDRAVRQLKENEGLAALPVPIDVARYIHSARAAGGYRPHQRITFPPIQAALDRFAEQRGLGANAWEAWQRRARQPTSTPGSGPVLSANRSTGVPNASSIET